VVPFLQEHGIDHVVIPKLPFSDYVTGIYRNRYRFPRPENPVALKETLLASFLAPPYVHPPINNSLMMDVVKLEYLPCDGVHSCLNTKLAVRSEGNEAALLEHENYRLRSAEIHPKKWHRRFLGSRVPTVELFLDWSVSSEETYDVPKYQLQFRDRSSGREIAFVRKPAFAGRFHRRYWETGRVYRDRVTQVLSEKFLVPGNYEVSVVVGSQSAVLGTLQVLPPLGDGSMMFPLIEAHLDREQTEILHPSRDFFRNGVCACRAVSRALDHRHLKRVTDQLEEIALKHLEQEPSCTEGSYALAEQAEICQAFFARHIGEVSMISRRLWKKVQRAAALRL
jgi:hypothetical protein